MVVVRSCRTSGAVTNAVGHQAEKRRSTQHADKRRRAEKRLMEPNGNGDMVNVQRGYGTRMDCIIFRSSASSSFGVVEMPVIK